MNARVGLWGIYLVLALSVVGIKTIRVVLRRKGFLGRLTDDNASAKELPEATSASVHIFGDERELDDLRELSLELFEPFIAPVAAVGRSKLEWISATLAVIVFILVRSVLSMGPIETAWAIVLATCLLLVAVRASVTYYRVSPGRLEVLRCRCFTSELRLVETVPLDQATVVCHFDTRTLTIDVNKDEGDRSDEVGAGRVLTRRTVSIDLDTLDVPHALVRAVCTCVLSRHSTPDLPVNQLAG